MSLPTKPCPPKPMPGPRAARSAAIFALAAAALAGCGSTTVNYYASPDDPMLAVGEKPPQGYPRTFTTRDKIGCVETTESWKREPKLLVGQTAWLKQIERKTVDCR